jgi:hypothetical protein
MKTVIILGEEYWFQQTEPRFTEAVYLLDILKNHNDKRFNYEILKNPSELIKTIERIKPENIRGIFLFQDVITDSYLNNKTVVEMKRYLMDLQNKNIFVYPPQDIIDNFGSKKYNQTLNDKLPWASLPGTRVVSFTNYNPKYENSNTEVLWKNVNEMWKEHTKVVIKKGYSYEGKQVQTFNRDFIKNFDEFKNKAHKLNKKYFWGQARSAISNERGAHRYYILQGFNRIVTKRENEYRVFFHNGKSRFIAKGDDIPNTCLKDEEERPLVKEIIKFAKKLYRAYLPLFWPLERQPILFRIDVSYAIDPEFQDEYSIKIKGFDSPVRIYANELEIDPTSFFYNPFECKSDKSFSSKTIQENMAKYIRKFIHTL